MSSERELLGSNEYTATVQCIVDSRAETSHCVGAEEVSSIVLVSVLNVSYGWKVTLLRSEEDTSDRSSDVCASEVDSVSCHQLDTF